MFLGVLMACFLASACVEEDLEGEPLVHSLASVRTVSQEEFAEELEVLLPGEWVLERSQGQRGAVPDVLDLTFLGHDATNGDVAFLLGEEASHDVQPARVVLIRDHALLNLPDQATSLKIDRITDNTLRLTIPRQSAEFIYARWR